MTQREWKTVPLQDGKRKGAAVRQECCWQAVPSVRYVPIQKKEPRQPPAQLTLICEWAQLPSGLELAREVEGKEEKEAREREVPLGWVSQWSKVTRGDKG